jgi:hypothetical protein
LIDVPSREALASYNALAKLLAAIRSSYSLLPDLETNIEKKESCTRHWVVSGASWSTWSACTRRSQAGGRPPEVSPAPYRRSYNLRWSKRIPSLIPMYDGYTLGDRGRQQSSKKGRS